MRNFEKLGAFYLGKAFDLRQNAVRDELLLYDSKDLTTHAVCVGMTGSGKTGLCLALLEEAAIDGVPAIALDPKGDLANLLLTFPNLEPQDFRPWIDESAATRAGLTPDQFAAQTAKKWREGLAAWGQGPDRIARYQDAVDRVVYTPGSNAGMPLTVLKGFAAPPPAVRDDADALRERVGSAASGLLALLGIDADPIRSREHILLSTVIDRAWRDARDLDIAGLIHAVQNPRVEKVGVFDLDSFFPPEDRLKLSMQLNNLLASPSFAGWMEGEPLDVKRLLHTPQGKPRLSIISIAHLSDSERMFFVTILLNEILTWARTQPGTSSLRALLYMDEVFGYFPPVAEPPSKKPMLTLLKQARAFGLGVVLATQNPVDLDYKGLSNTGTWFLGRLQTERDKARVLEGLEGASVSSGAAFDRGRMEATLAGLGNRVFLMHNVHEDKPVVFQTRWVLSYLRGPMTRAQIGQLTESRKQQASDPAPPPGPVAPVLAMDDLSLAAPTPAAAPSDAGAKTSGAGSQPPVSPKVKVCFLSRTGALPEGSRLVYRPAVLSRMRLHFVRATYKVDVWRERTLVAPIRGELADAPWEEATLVDGDRLVTQTGADAAAEFATLPAVMLREKCYAELGKKLKGYLYRTQTASVWKCAELKQYSEPGEAEGDFRVRLQHVAHEARDLKVEKLRKRYASKLATLQSQIRTAEQRIAREKSQASKASYETLVSVGSSVLGALLGRKLASRTNVGKAATSMRSLGRAAEQRGDVAQAKEKLNDLKSKLVDLEGEFQKEVDQVEASYAVDRLEVEELFVRPRKTDTTVADVALLWTPWLVDADGIASAAFSLDEP